MVQTRVVAAVAASASLMAAAGATVVAPTVAAAAPPLVDTVSAQRVYDAYGVSAHPEWQGGSTYNNVDAWVQRLDSLGVPYFRGGYEPGSQGTLEAIAASRKYGVKWLMGVVPEAGRSPTTQTPAETRAVVEQIGRTAADVVYGMKA